MITNERQYRITKAWVDRFAHGADQTPADETELDPAMRQLYRDAYESQAHELREQLVEYEALQTGQVSVLELDSLTALPEALIRARIAAGLTQKQLAERLGLKEQQIQRYEATRYRGANLERIQAVADALGARIHQRVSLLVAAN